MGQSLRLLDALIVQPLVEIVGTLEFGLDVLYMTCEMPGFVLEPTFLRTACHVTLGPPYMLTHPIRIYVAFLSISGYSVWALEYFVGRWLDLFHSTSFSQVKHINQLHSAREIFPLKQVGESNALRNHMTDYVCICMCVHACMKMHVCTRVGGTYVISS